MLRQRRIGQRLASRQILIYLRCCCCSGSYRGIVYCAERAVLQLQTLTESKASSTRLVKPNQAGLYPTSAIPSGSTTAHQTCLHQTCSSEQFGCCHNVLIWPPLRKRQPPYGRTSHMCICFTPSASSTELHSCYQLSGAILLPNRPPPPSRPNKSLTD
jgi:hypothetical protein